MSEEKIKNRIRATLLEMSGQNGHDFMDRLKNLSEMLENKIDPSQNELYILENIYKVQESLNILKTNLEKYNQGESIVTNGSKLSELFEKQSLSSYY